MQVTLRKSVIGFTCVIWIVTIAYAWFVLRHDPSCADSEKITTEADALEFGKYTLRRHRSIWEEEFRSVAELDRTLQTDGCCSASRIDSKENNGREWSVLLKLVGSTGRYYYFYDVQFTSCRHRIEDGGISMRD